MSTSRAGSFLTAAYAGGLLDGALAESRIDEPLLACLRGDDLEFLERGRAGHLDVVSQLCSRARHEQ